jgi:hypothetical protein
MKAEHRRHFLLGVFDEASIDFLPRFKDGVNGFGRHYDLSPQLEKGRANPGDAYVTNFGTETAPHHRVLICGHAGLNRRVVTIFARSGLPALEKLA